MSAHRRVEVAMFVALAFSAAAGLTACTAGSGITSADVAEQVTTRIDDRVGVRAEVDCGDDQADIPIGSTLECEVTDPNAATTYTARVEIVASDRSSGYDVRLAVDPQPKLKQNEEGEL